MLQDTLFRTLDRGCPLERVRAAAANDEPYAADVWAALREVGAAGVMIPTAAFATDPVIPEATIAARKGAPVVPKNVNKLYNLAAGQYALFDLAKDPGEIDDIVLADRDRLTALVQKFEEMRGRLHEQIPVATPQAPSPTPSASSSPCAACPSPPPKPTSNK